MDPMGVCLQGEFTPMLRHHLVNFRHPHNFPTSPSLLKPWKENTFKWKAPFQPSVWGGHSVSFFGGVCNCGYPCHIFKAVNSSWFLLLYYLGISPPKTSLKISRPRNASVQPRPGNAWKQRPTPTRDLSWAPCPKKMLFLLVASTHLKHISQLGNPPQIEVNT